MNFFGTDLLKRTLPRRASASLTLQLYLPVVLQLIQGVLTVVLATLTAEGLEPVDCILEGNWSRLYRAKDDRALERIQDTFNCCGLRSIVDRTAPRGECKNIYKDRHDSCLSPWHASMQRSAGLDFAVALAVGIFQVRRNSYYLAIAVQSIDGNGSSSNLRSSQYVAPKVVGLVKDMGGLFRVLEADLATAF